MQFSVEEKPGVKVVRLCEKRLDTNVAPHLKAEFLVLLSKAPYNFVVDLSEVEYADSSGLGALLLGLRQAREKQGGLVLLKPQRRVQDLIKIAHLQDVLNTFEDEQVAIESLRQPEP